MSANLMHCHRCGFIHPYEDDEGCLRTRRNKSLQDQWIRALEEFDRSAGPAASDPRIEAPLRGGEGCLFHRPIVVTGDERKLFIGKNVRIDAFVKIEIGEGVVIGDNTHIASFAHLNIGGGFLYIGERCGIASGARIVTGGNDVNSQSMTATAPETSSVYTSRVTIMEDVSVLVNAVVLPGALLDKGSRLAAGSVLMKRTHIPPRELWAGAPAKYVRTLS